MVVNASDRDSSTSHFQNSHIRSSKATIGSPINKRPIVRRRVFRHMVDVGLIDRERVRIGIYDVLKGGVIKSEGLTGFSVVQIRVCRGIGGGGVWITCGSVSRWMLGVRVCVMGINSPLGEELDLVVALCFLSSLMATSLKSLYMFAGRKMGPGDLLGMGLPGGGKR